jgi:prolipoprotein diacylglyceryltransferase
LIALAAWVGCASQGCAYGAEVDTLARYSPLAVGETRDLYGILAPRYNTQLFGAGVALVCLIIALVLRKADKRNLTAGDAKNAEDFWLILSIFSIGVFFIGFWRGDASPRWVGLRGDQVFDVVLFALAAVMLFYVRLRTQSK